MYRILYRFYIVLDAHTRNINLYKSAKISNEIILCDRSSAVLDCGVLHGGNGEPQKTKHENEVLLERWYTQSHGNTNAACNMKNKTSTTQQDTKEIASTSFNEFLTMQY